MSPPDERTYDPEALLAECAAKVRELEALRRRASALQRFISALAPTASVAEVAEVAAAHGADLFGARATLLFLLAEGGETLDLLAFGGMDASRMRGYEHVPVNAPSPLGLAVRERRPVFIESREALLSSWPAYADQRDESGAPLSGIVALPIRAGDRSIGGVVFCFYSTPESDEVQHDYYLTVASQCGVAIERATAFAAERDALRAEAGSIECLRQERERLSTLARLPDVLATSLDSRQALIELVRATAPALADWCAIDEFGPDGAIRQLAVHHSDPKRLALVHRLQSEYPRSNDTSHGVGRVLATGEPEFVAGITPEMLASGATSPEHAELLRGLNLSCYATIPLKARGRVLGALSLATEHPRQLTEEDLRFAEEVTRRSALALDNARLFEASEAARTHLHDVLMHVPARIAILRGRDLRCEFLNRAAGDLARGEPVLGQPVEQAFPDLAGSGMAEQMRRVYESGAPYTANEARGSMDPHTPETYLNLVYQPLRNAEAEVDGLLTCAFDVTEQVTARRSIEGLVAELARSESRMRALVDATTAIVWSASAQGEILEASPSWLEFTGQAPKEYLAGGFEAAIHPEDRKAAMLAWRTAVARGEPYEHEARLRRADGTYAHTLARGVPVRHLGAQVAEYVGCHIDVSELRKAEADTRQHAATLATLNHLALILAAELDIGKVVQAVIDVATQLTGAEFGAFIHGVGDEQGREPPPVTLANIRGAAARPIPFLVHLVSPSPAIDGSTLVRIGDLHANAYRAREMGVRGKLAGDLPVRSYLAVPVLSRSGTAVGRIVLAHRQPDWFDERAESLAVRLSVNAALAMDNAQLHKDSRRLIQALEASNRDLDQFAHVASHDLKAPLRGIASLADWIEEDAGAALPPAATKNLRLLRGRVVRLEGLINGILEFSRVGRAPAVQENVCVASVVQDVGELLAIKPPKSLVIVGTLPMMFAERIALQQVFLNLVANAVRHGGRADLCVTISASPCEAGWEFRVADNGCGISPEFHERIWRMFQTLEARDRVENTGIGLAIVKKIVEAHGGRVAVDSRAGHGAAFLFTWADSRAGDPTGPPPEL